MTDNSSPPTLILGLGNPILGDDGVGWRVAEAAKAALANLPEPLQGSQRVEVDTFTLGGLSLMERMLGYERAILIDAIQTGQRPPGTLSVFPLEALDNPFAGHLGSPHETNLQTALEVGRKLGAQLPAPDQVMVVAVEAEKVYEFSENLSPAVTARLAEAVEMVVKLASNFQ
jgi:hydrogenase maturation protease